MTDLLTIREAAAYLRIAPETLRNKMSTGIFRVGTHYVRPPGLGPRFKRAALERWLAGGGAAPIKSPLLAGVPMARHALTRAGRRR